MNRGDVGECDGLVEAFGESAIEGCGEERGAGAYEGFMDCVGDGWCLVWLGGGYGGLV